MAKARRAREVEREKINARTHAIVQPVPAFKYERGYSIGYFTSQDPRMFFRRSTITYLQSDHAQSAWNQQQIQPRS